MSAILPVTSGPIERGQPYPLGATFNGIGTNFAVFSAHAEKIEVCLFDAAGRHETARHVLPECTDEVWHGYLPGVLPGTLYGFRAYGPYRPEYGHRFNHNKLLLDPYARQLHGQVRWTDALFAYRMHSLRADMSFDRRDSAPAVPKAMVTDSAFNWHDDRGPQVPWDKTVIYEAHLRGLTMLDERVRQNERGTFAGLANPHVIEHLVKLGVTSLELLPIHASLQDRRLMANGLRNYWGYNTLSFFAPEPRYLASGSLDEVRHAVRQLHSAGIEVILDVVYNHTCEESELGPTLSWRGLDNASYYRLHAGNHRHLVNDTGCGNTLNMSHPRAIQMVMDSLRYWVQEFHIDGFRFDLGATLGREHFGFDPNSGFFDALMQDPVLARVKLISEPWDIGPGGHQTGNHPPGFAEWNDRFRDTVRGFWKGDAGMRSALAPRLLGSPDLFDKRRRRPWASVNFVTAHDGFTLNDLVSYNDKHNDANLEDNNDGSNDNRSYNWGAEGPTDDPEVTATRDKVKRAMLMTLMFSNGTPMLLGGDEFGRTQLGNNNAYCQDNEISWLDWNLADTDAGRALMEFTRRCIAVRRERPTLRSAEFMTAAPRTLNGVPDTSWFDETGHELTPERWGFAEGRLLALRRLARSDKPRHENSVAASLLLLNAFSEDRKFVLPSPAMPWRVAIDGAHPLGDPSHAEHAHAAGHISHNRITVAAHSAILLVADL